MSNLVTFELKINVNIWIKSFIYLIKLINISCIFLSTIFKFIRYVYFIF